MTLKQKVISAAGWSVGVKLLFQSVTWGMTLLVVRILSPDDYGLMAVSQVSMNFMVGFANLGLADALIQRESTPRPVVASVFGVLLLTSTALTVLFALAAYPVSEWYGDARLIPLLQVSSLGFLFNALTALPRVYLTKSLRVRPMFLVELSSGLVGAVAVMALAYLQYGVWALLLGWLASNVIKLCGFSVLAHEHYLRPRFDLRAVAPLISYGAYRTLEYTVWIAFTSADVLIIGHWLGSTELGLYTVALNFAAMPLSKMAPVFNTVAFPAFAMVQTQPETARLYALKSMRMMATISVPIFFGICAAAPEIVDLAFGPNWAAAKPVLAVLALAVTFRAILLVIPNYLQGIGDARAGFWCTAAGAVVFLPAFMIGCQWGILGVCYAWLIGYPAVFSINALIAAQRGGLDFRALLSVPIRPMIAGAIMIAVVTALRATLPLELPEIVRFAAVVAAGAATYGAVLFLAFPDLAEEILQFIPIGSSAGSDVVPDARGV